MRKSLTTEEFVRRAKEVHGDKYDYTNTVYVNRRTKIKFICPVHGEQEQPPESHILHGCGLCGKEIGHEKKRLKLDDIIRDFKNTHSDRYDYSKVNYINIDTPVEIICPEHGSFWQSPYEHRKGSNCPKCYGLHKTNEQIIEEARKVHGDKYDYSELEYVNAHTKMKIICPEHGEFYQNHVNHIAGKQGCPECAKLARGHS